MPRANEDELVFDAGEIGHLIGIDWAERATTLRASLASALVRIIDAEVVPPGARMPAERTLADALSVSRTTVNAAYDTLRELGRLTSRQGGYTRVPHRYRPAEASRGLRRLAGNDLFTQLASSEADVSLVEARGRSSEILERTMPGPQMLDLATRGHGYHPQGAVRLRRLLADRLTREGLPTTVDELLLTNGAQQATDLVFRYWLRFNGVLATEDPNFAGVLDLIRLNAARQLALPVHGGTIDLGPLHQALAHRRPPSLVYVTPDSHNPTGASMSLRQRTELVTAAEAHDLALVENLVMRNVAAAPTCPPLGAMLPHRVVSIGSLSPRYWAGLRIGWVRAAAPLVDALTMIRSAIDLGGPVLNQLWAAEVIEAEHDPTPSRHAEYARAHDLACETLAAVLPTWTVESPPSSPWLWVDTRLDVGDLRRRAAHYGLRLADPRTWSLHGSVPTMLRIPLSRSADELRNGLYLLERIVVREYPGQRPRTRRSGEKSLDP